MPAAQAAVAPSMPFLTDCSVWPDETDDGGGLERAAGTGDAESLADESSHVVGRAPRPSASPMPVMVHDLLPFSVSLVRPCSAW